jgi:prepilin-type N-terminal cleavage/methylation domain-containing protein
MSSRCSARRGFTLVELLVAVAIMSFMLLMMGQVVGLAEKASRQEQNRIDNYTKARSMLDLITDDLQRAIFRGDLPIFGTGAPATTPTVTSTGLSYFTATSFTTAFYTRLPGADVASPSTPVRDVSLVSYVLNSTDLQRSDMFVPWTSSQNLAFQANMAPLLTTMLTTTTPLEVAPGVVGFRMVFRRADGTLIDQSQYTGYTTATPANPVVAVDVGLAVVGKESLQRLTVAQLQKIQSTLAAATITNGIKSTWDQQTLTASFYSGFPSDLGLGDGLKTFERWVACPPF